MAFLACAWRALQVTMRNIDEISNTERDLLVTARHLNDIVGLLGNYNNL